MPLLDHFHNPIAALSPWSSFHGSWVTMLVGSLNRLLLPRYRARGNYHLGRQVAADVAECRMEDTRLVSAPAGANGSGGVAVATWAPPVVTTRVPIHFPDDIEVQVVDPQDGGVVVAVIELVSPSNKDRDDSQRGFAAKCAAYLQRGLGLIVVDVVTERNARLYARLMEMLGQTGSEVVATAPEIHAAAFRPIQRDERTELDIWLEPLQIGETLPTLPLALHGAGCVPVDLEATYMQARSVEGV
jgi:hypothetical protein